jgi:carbamoyl-phosphate synthase large subunit
MKILITSIGRRIQLIKHLKSDLELVGVDCNDDIAGKFFVDKFYKIPKFDNKNYINRLIEISKKENINMIIPLYEREFYLLCEERDRFTEIGVHILLSSKEIIEICNYKENTQSFFEDNNINSPKTYILEDLNKDLEFPLIIKPSEGMGSQNVFKVKNRKELIFFSEYVENPIIQKFIDGEEYTVDVLCDFKGRPVYIIPRKRIEVRSGEVSKSKVVLDSEIIEQTKRVIEKLNTYKDKNGLGVQGPITIQCFKEKNGEITFLEINPRFGGGVPLSFEAGANYSDCLNKMLNEEHITYIQKDIKELTMIRFDDGIFY